MAPVKPRTERRKTDEEAPPSDPELIARIAQGEIGAMGILFDRYAEDLRRVVARLGVRPPDIDDVVQAAFLEVLHAAATYDGRDHAKPWLAGLAVIQTRRHRRSLARIAARIAAFGKEPEHKAATPEDLTQGRELAMRTQRAFEALSLEKREVVTLVTLEGLPGDEVAKLLGIPVATVWTRLHRARVELSHAVFEEESQ